MNFKYYFLLTLALLATAFTGNQLQAQTPGCDAGTLLTTGTVEVCSETATFNVATDGFEAPGDTEFSFSFDDSQGGTGGLAGGFRITTTNNDQTWDSDLSGILSSNGLDVLGGTWVIKAQVLEADLSICSITADSLTVNFGDFVIADIVDNMDGSATVTAGGGMAPYTYLWSDPMMQTTQTATGLVDGAYSVTVTDAAGCEVVGGVAVGDPAASCDAGNLTPTGDTTLCNGDDTFTVMASNLVIPPDGELRYLFTNTLGGTGALGGPFTLFGVEETETWDSDLNGVLSSNGFPPFSGTWTVKIQIRTTAGGEICSESTDSLNFTYSTLDLTATNNGDLTATANATGGSEPYTYLWSDPMMQTTATAVDLLAGDYMVTVTDAAGCERVASVTVDFEADPCEDFVNGPFTDFNSTFGGAPCDDGTGCPFNEITAFEVWASEAYTVNGFVMGGTYTFSMCNGDGAGSWVPEFTIIAPSGAVDAFGPGDGDGCSITWTASEDGTYIIAINEAGFCGTGSANEATNNGFPALTCESGGPAICPPTVDVCTVGEYITTGVVPVCGDGATFLVQVLNDTVPTGGGFGWSFDNSLGGTGALDGNFVITNSSDSVVWDADLSGILSSNGFPPLAGSWIVTPFVYTDAMDPQGTICDAGVDQLIVSFGPLVFVEATDNADGSATATPSEGTAPYAYNWSDGQNTQTATELVNDLYFVTVTDANGCTAVDSVQTLDLAVDNIEALTSLSVAPNPTITGQFNVNVQLEGISNLEVTVLDVTGRTITSQKRPQAISEQLRFDLSGQAAGIYMVRIEVDGESTYRRVVLAR